MRKKRILIANRGEIAVRIIRACEQSNVETVLVVSEADKESLPARLADKVVCIGPAPAGQSYLNIPMLIATAQGTGCDAIHPGYGFLAENPELPLACEKNGIIFIGPRSETMRQLGDKIRARKIATECGVPINQGSDGLSDYKVAEAIAQELGFPILFKASAGGGGRGMRIVRELKELKNAFDMASNEAQKAFGDPTLFMERYVQNARHVEVQILGDNFGRVIHLGQRDCSSQRRYQKVIEEARPIGLPEELTDRISAAAVALAKGINYNNAATVEFLVDMDRQQFYFMEVNTRIQVEHPVTEEVTGVDLVKEQIRIAFGHPLALNQSEVKFKGHAIECRITAEDSRNDFMPTPGQISRFVVPYGDNIRVDTHCYQGYTISPYYDSLMAKVIATGETRDSALQNLKSALASFQISGVETNIPFLQFLIAQPEFATGEIHVKWIENTVMPKFLAAMK
ncbi:MAG: acetyl-CoA carboxylase biotin carboxylase subunit [Desulfuromonadales bacterium]|nr:acetyl-CoA carboxylase biotin carboxylase subunit [Desulfuromonadales bacterium]